MRCRQVCFLFSEGYRLDIWWRAAAKSARLPHDHAMRCALIYLCRLLDDFKYECPSYNAFIASLTPSKDILSRLQHRHHFRRYYCSEWHVSLSSRLLPYFFGFVILPPRKWIHNLFLSWSWITVSRVRDIECRSVFRIYIFPHSIILMRCSTFTII